MEIDIETQSQVAHCISNLDVTKGSLWSQSKLHFALFFQQPLDATQTQHELFLPAAAGEVQAGYQEEPTRGWWAWKKLPKEVVTALSYQISRSIWTPSDML